MLTRYSFARPGTTDFIAQQMQIMARMQAEQEQRARELATRRLQRPRQQQEHEETIPEIPPVPASLP